MHDAELGIVAGAYMSGSRTRGYSAIGDWTKPTHRPAIALDEWVIPEKTLVAQPTVQTVSIPSFELGALVTVSGR